MGRAVQGSVSYLPLPALQPDPPPTQARGSSPMDAHSLWVRSLSSHRVLVPGTAVETAKKGPFSLLTQAIPHSFRRAGPRGQTPSLLTTRLTAAFGAPAKAHWRNIFFFKGKKREKEKRKEKRGSTKKNHQPQNPPVQRLNNLPSVTPQGSR